MHPRFVFKGLLSAISILLILLSSCAIRGPKTVAISTDLQRVSTTTVKGLSPWPYALAAAHQYNLYINQQCVDTTRVHCYRLVTWQWTTAQERRSLVFSSDNQDIFSIYQVQKLNNTSVSLDQVYQLEVDWLTNLLQEKGCE